MTMRIESVWMRPLTISLLLGALVLAVGCGGPSQNRVLVITRPAGGDVYVNGLLIGKAPVRCRLLDTRPPDMWEEHLIEAKLPGYKTARKEIRYRTGAAWLPERIILTLDTDMGGIDVVSASPKPTVTIVTETPAPKPKPKPKPAPKVEPKPVAPKPSSPTSKPKVVEATPAAEAREFQPPAKPYAKTSPWTRLAPPADSAGPDAAEVQWTAPAENRRISIELRLLKLDGVAVVRQASVSGRWGQRDTLVAEMVNDLLHGAVAKTDLALVALRNRRETINGDQIADRVTASVLASLRRSGHFQTVTQHNFSMLLGGETNMEMAKVFREKNVRKVLKDAKYVVLGGVALADKDSEIEAAAARKAAREAAAAKRAEERAAAEAKRAEERAAKEAAEQAAAAKQAEEDRIEAEKRAAEKKAKAEKRAAKKAAKKAAKEKAEAEKKAAEEKKKAEEEAAKEKEKTENEKNKRGEADENKQAEKENGVAIEVVPVDPKNEDDEEKEQAEAADEETNE